MEDEARRRLRGEEIRALEDNDRNPARPPQDDRREDMGRVKNDEEGRGKPGGSASSAQEKNCITSRWRKLERSEGGGYVSLKRRRRSG